MLDESNIYNITSTLRSYKKIKSRSWPVISSIEEFINLPDKILSECHSLHDVYLTKQILNELKNTTLLITFGCSWTFGIGLNYIAGMSKDEYKQNKVNSNLIQEHSFRAKLSKKYNLTNINFSQGGSSNQLQFRQAREFFTNSAIADVLSHSKNVIVLWGVTSTARNELWCNKTNTYKNFVYNPTYTNNTKFHKQYIKNTYDHDVEVKHLSEEMYVWDGFFKSAEYKTIWFDTFNTHDYSTTLNSIIPIDLLTQLSNITSNDYHESVWKDSDIRTDYAIDKMLINPHSLHPTIEGHNVIANILSPYIKKLL